MRRVCLVLMLPLVACEQSVPSDTEPTGSETDDIRAEGEDTDVVVFDAEYVHFGEQNRRTVDVEVTLPDASSTYASITGQFALTCPNDACDYWDRYGTFGIVLDAGTEDEQYIELDRFITAYRVGFSWEADLTDYRPLLADTVTMRVFIDTWVTEGHAQGDGWLFDATLSYAGGPPPSPEPVAVVPVWGHQSWSAGLAESPVEEQVVPATVALQDHTQATFRSFITGHGWNNTQNCAEFCEKEHFFTVAEEEFSKGIWRDDCSETETDGRQQGTWTYSRAGWCPGAQVFPWDTDVTDAIGGATEADVSYRLEDFEWAGDGDQPYYYLSGVLLLAD